MASSPVNRFEEFLDRLASGEIVTIEYDNTTVDLNPMYIDQIDLRDMAEEFERLAERFERLRFSVDGGEILFDNNTPITEIIEYWKTQPREDYDEVLGSI